MERDDDDFEIDFTKSPASIGQQIQRRNQQLQTQSVDATPIQEDPFFGLKKDLVNFFSNRISEIKAKDEIQHLIIEKFTEMIDRDELGFDQMMSVYNTIGRDSRGIMDSILAVFRPTPGVASPFAQNVAQQDEKQDVFDQVYENMSSEDLENISKLMMIMRTMGKEKTE